MSEKSYSFSNKIENYTSNEISLKFVNDVSFGDEDIFVDDELLSNEAVCQARAESIFLEQSYLHNFKTVRTWHRDELILGKVVMFDETYYIIEEIDEDIKSTIASITLKLKRWDFG